MTTIALVLLALGFATQIVVLFSSRPTLPRFTKVCPTCGYQVPPLDRPPSFHDCPECDRIFSLNDPMPD
ncbi:hypothetical protein LEP3755_10050 [Leptolyngbya sp. NIES-3755]|nr:hypothetical protein LEP3755_10050 [Leptolyngbya sp. NIES-3755]